MENGILLPTLQSALPFLDLHGTPRLEFHQSVFDELREKLMERVARIAEGKEEDRYDSWISISSIFDCSVVLYALLYAFPIKIILTQLQNKPHFIKYKYMDIIAKVGFYSKLFSAARHSVKRLSRLVVGLCFGLFAITHC